MISTLTVINRFLTWLNFLFFMQGDFYRAISFFSRLYMIKTKKTSRLYCYFYSLLLLSYWSKELVDQLSRTINCLSVYRVNREVRNKFGLYLAYQYRTSWVILYCVTEESFLFFVHSCDVALIPLRNHWFWCFKSIDCFVSLVRCIAWILLCNLCKQQKKISRSSTT